MTLNQSNIIIKPKKYYISTYSEVLNLSFYTLVTSNELLSISQIITDYFKRNIETSLCGTKLAIQMPNGDKNIIKLNQKIAFGITLKDFTGGSISSKIKRVINHDDVYKKLLDIADIYREVYYFSKSKDEYITSFALKRFNEKELRNEQFLNNSTFITSSGSFGSKKSMSSTKEIKANELVGNCKQIEQLAMDTNKSWISATITCPAIFHITPQNKQSNWDGIVTPKDANKFQNKIWENTSRQLGKKGMYPFGFWVKEVNRSSAIHRHVLIYCDVAEIIEIKKWLIHYANAAYDDLNSKFIEDKSIYFDSGHYSDLSKFGTKKTSTITNYINKINIYYLKPKKYFSSLNKHRIDLEIVNKHNAHAEKYKYRRFGFFGLQKCLTLWKHLKYFAKNNTCKNISSPLKKVVDLAKKNELAKFIRNPLRKKLSLIYSSKDTYDVENKNFYGDKIKKVFGIKFNGKDYYTKERHLCLSKQITIYFQLFIFLFIKNIKICN